MESVGAGRTRTHSFKGPAENACLVRGKKIPESVYRRDGRAVSDSGIHLERESQEGREGGIYQSLERDTEEKS